MAHIKLDNIMPGIVGLLWTKPSTGKPMAKFAQNLLKGSSTLTSAEREMIASYVSSKNDCNFCCNSHSAAAAHYLGGNDALISDIKKDPQTAKVSDKMKALLAIAGKVQQSGKSVNKDDFENARKVGATDEELHEAVLIAAAFCMFNRYVDGLGTLEPEDKDEYKDMGKRMAEKGYGVPNMLIRKIVNWSETRKKEKAKAAKV